MHATWIAMNLKFNWIELNSSTLNLNSIQFNWREIRCKLAKVLKNIFMNMVLKNKTKTLRGHKSKKVGFPCLFTWEWNKQIPFWNCSNDNYKLWNSKLSYLNQFQWTNITTPYYQLQWHNEIMKKNCENMFHLNDNIEWHWKQTWIVSKFHFIVTFVTPPIFFLKKSFKFLLQ